MFDRTSNLYVGYIYCISNDLNCKKYIGQTTTTIQKRFAEHKRCALSYPDSTQLIYRVMRKYGCEHFTVTMLCSEFSNSVSDLKQKLNEREMYYIQTLGTLKPNGYNMTVGGDSFAEHHFVPVYKVDKDGNVLALFRSMTEAENANGLPPGSIKRAFLYENHYANGFYWYNAEEVDFSVGDNIGEQVSPGRSKGVCMLDLDGNVLGVFESMADAEKSTGIYHGKISMVCNGKRKTTGGYMWRYS